MKISFAPGPSQLYFTVEDHLRRALKEGIGSISHRSKEFESISIKVTSGLRKLLSIPGDFHIFFTSSATETWERSIQNLVERNSFHLVNGAFSNRYHEIAAQLGKSATKVEVEKGQGFGELEIPADTELIAVTHNETSTGVSLPLDFIQRLKDNSKDALVIVDAVSSLPYPQFDYTKVDSVFFSVQKGFGLPAGLGVWIVNDRCVEKAIRLQAKGNLIGTYHSIPSFLSNSKKNQTPETPNVLSIYLLANVVADMLNRGIESIRKETEYKAALLYQTLASHSLVKPFVKETVFQSKTVIVADCGEHTESIAKALQSKGLYPGEGYGESKKSQLRFANFPTHSKEQYECLVDALGEIR